MPRPRKPTALLELTGAFRKNPQRRHGREAEPKPTGPIGEPPLHLSPEAAAVWEEVLRESAPGVLTRSDRMILECICIAALRIRSPSCCAADLAQLKQLLQQIGMTPAARSNVSVGPEEKPNPFLDL